MSTSQKHAPENRPFAPKGKFIYLPNHPFSGANLLLVSGRVAMGKLENNNDQTCL